MAGVVLRPLGASATPPLQKQALELGFAATDCSYCHSFTMEHMRKRALEAGVSSMNCGACHGNKLPKTGAAFFSERGRWLVDQKIRRNVKAVDMAWLRDYPTKDAKPTH
jgi:hypothetical protein